MAFLNKIFAVVFGGIILLWVAIDSIFSPFSGKRYIEFLPGVTFSLIQSDSLNLDWKETYLSILSDLKVKRIRIPIYWDEVERKEGEFDFSRFDFLIKNAELYDAKIVIAIGQKLPRWPECHIPRWARQIFKIQNSKFEISPQGRKAYEDALIFYVRKVVERYKDIAAVEAWQIENEPFFEFGECPKISYNLIKREIEAVKALDKRPIIITDSGELGTWFQAARLADIVGTTMYRITWKKGIGYFRYFIPPSFYEKKASFISFIFKKPVWIMEMQLEPWVPSLPILNHSIKEQMRSMSFEQFKSNIEYARASKLSPIYFWGAEWWYWMKSMGHPEFWNYIKENVFDKI